MKWTVTTPEEGDTREVRRFAWWPTRMTDSGLVVWLDSYHETQVYESHVSTDMVGLPYTESGWVATRQEYR